MLLRRTGMSPDHMTVIGVLVSVGAAFAVGAGALRVGLLLVILAAVPDMLDGALAKAQNSILLGGVAWYFASEKSAHLAILPMAVMGVSSLISYERAKAESLGLDAKGGLMERAERIIVLCFGLLFDNLLVPVMWVMLVLTTATAVQRFVKVWRQAEVSATVQARRDRRQVRRVTRPSSRANRRTLSVSSRQRRRTRHG
jgi:CDP-diacylglycerol--glycerol-3-phosphate 3-phosphatidyltransferase